jgi:transcriptional regulator with XRE-family HTH domain
VATTVSPITPSQITRLRSQLGLSGQAFAGRINETDPLLRLDRNAVSRYERGVQSPGPHVAAAIARLWLHEGYPCTTGDHDAILATNHSASSYGQPVVLIGDVPHGSAEVGPLDLGDAPVAIVDAVQRAGYEVAG